jgi:leader peptidase (prepilin peptidase)/N-methyltransferase
VVIQVASHLESKLIKGAVVGANLPPLFFYLVILIFGLIFGSFNTVLVARIPMKESLWGRSKCTLCEVQIQNRDNIPIYGYLRLRGKCRNCGQEFSRRYLYLELTTAVAIFIPFLLFDRLTMIAAWMAFVILGVALSAIDFQLHRLPDVLNGALYLSGIVFLSLDAALHHRFGHLRSAVIASVLLSAFYWLVNLLSKGGMGMGDVKLAASIGLFAGYISALCVYVAAMASFALGSLVGIAIIVLQKGTRKTAVPFGPFMIVGTLISIWATPLIWQ